MNDSQQLEVLQMIQSLFLMFSYSRIKKEQTLSNRKSFRKNWLLLLFLLKFFQKKSTFSLLILVLLLLIVGFSPTILGIVQPIIGSNQSFYLIWFLRNSILKKFIIF